MSAKERLRESGGNFFNLFIGGIPGAGEEAIASLPGIRDLLMIHRIRLSTFSARKRANL